MLHDDVKLFLDEPDTPVAQATQVGEGHGRIETRVASVSPIFDQSHRLAARTA